MKYIRTKDGIYEVKDDFIVLKGQELYLPHFQDHIVAQADTIEELCDRFVLITNRAHYGFGHFGNIKRVVLGKEEKFIACYGAIWTEWGLKYVAKMNEDGVLCLI